MSDANNAWVQWIAPSGLLVVAGVIGWLWRTLENLKASILQMPHQAQEKATEMDSKIWDELRLMREQQTAHVQRMNDMHLEIIKTVAQLPTRTEMQAATDRSAERIVQVLNNRSAPHEGV